MGNVYGLKLISYRSVLTMEKDVEAHEVTGRYSDILGHVPYLSKGSKEGDFRDHVKNICIFVSCSCRGELGGLQGNCKPSVMGMLLETFPRDRIYSPLERLGLISNSQYNYIHGRSYLTILIFVKR